MPPIDGLIFAGYRSFDAGADDSFRIKWNAVRPSLELPAGAEIPALTMPAISGFNADINQRIIYTRSQIAATPGKRRRKPWRFYTATAKTTRS
jgi:hypothetical protein